MIEKLRHVLPSHLSHILKSENTGKPVAKADPAHQPPPVHHKIGAIDVFNPKFDLSKAKVIVWDMDGTLYSQNPMLDQYRKDFRETFSDSLKPIYDTKSQDVIRGNSLFKVGHSYDPKNKLILRKNHEGKVLYGYELSGRPVSPERLQKLYPKPLHGDEGIIHIDNKIKALEVLGVSLGKTMQEADAAYFATRDRYFNDLAGKNPSPGLPQFLSVLQRRGHAHLVSTAAPLEGAKEMLDHLNILPHLHKIHTGVSKPFGMQELLQRVIEEHGVKANEILVIGNESGMDLIVPHRMGVQTLLIQEDQGQNLEGADAKVDSLQGLMTSLRHFNDHRRAPLLSFQAA